MKRFFRFVMAAAVIFSAVSCAKEDISSTIGGGEVEVTFTANLAGLGTRAIADGNTVDRVYLAIFDAKADTYLGELTADAGYPVSNGLATIPVVLLKDKEYDLVFWAQKDGTGAYTLDLEHRKVKANYGVDHSNNFEAWSNNEERDAFFNISNDWTAGKDNTTFELRRPFAQINVGNSDADVKYAKQNGSEIKQSAMTVTTEVYDTIELVNGSLTGTKVSAEFVLRDIPAETIQGTVDPTHDATLNASAEYNYLAMNYLLVNDRQLVDLVFKFTDGATTFERKYFQVPVQRNYRTNILGQIISSPMDFNVIIVPDFNTPDSDLQGDTQTFNVSSKAELEDALAKAAGQNHIQHLIINLNADVALDVAAWQTLAIGNKNTKDITINGSKTRAANDDYYTLTFNNTNSDWNNIVTNGAKLILESLNITNSGHDATSGTWNAHDIVFACEVEMNNVVSLNAIALQANAKIENTTINDDHTGSSYAVWIQPNGQTVTINNCTIDTTGAGDGRGIKIDEQYVDAPEKVILNVSNTEFVTKSKAAILVKSAAGAEIVWGEGNNISKVAADKVNAVWVDEDADDYYDLVEVTGCTKMLEGALDNIMEDLKNDKDVTLISNVTGSAAASSGYGATGIVIDGQTVDGGGHTLTVNGANGTWDSAVNHKGGTLKNITVAGAFRGVFMSGANADVYIDNVIFKDVVYTFNSDDGNKEYGVYISNSTLNGWTSHSDVHKEVVYTNCSFGEGRGNAFCRPYGPTTFVRCNFCEGYKIEPLTEILLVDCKLNGVAITDANISDIVTDPSKVKFAPVVNNTDALKDALETETYVKVAAGNYTFPASSIKAGATIECAEGTVFKGASSLDIKGATVIGATFSNPTGNAVGSTINGTFKNCTFTGSNALRYTYAGETVVFDNCVFSGSTYGIHFDGGANDVIFRNCTISGFNGLGAELTLVTFENCTFVGNGKSGYNGANLWGSAKLVNCEFTFNGTTANEWIDCIGADKTYEFENCTINGVDYTAENYKSYDNIFSRNNVTVKINGVDCAM